jgi:outer membrane receptor protein involved in Fe transport
MSEWQYNIAGIFEKYGVSARLAYNWRSSYLLTTSAANINRPIWFDDYGQLDGSIFYTLSDNWKVGVQATNLLNERTVLLVSSDANEADGDPAGFRQKYSWTDTDRRVAFVVRATY